MAIMVNQLVQLEGVLVDMMYNNLDRLVNIFIAFAIIFVLLYMCYVTLYIQDMWDMIIEYQNVLAEQQKELRNLKILIISMKGTAV